MSTKTSESSINGLEYIEMPSLDIVMKSKTNFICIIQRLRSEGVIKIGKKSKFKLKAEEFSND